MFLRSRGTSWIPADKSWACLLYTSILGGSKVSSKIGVINNLLDIADTIIIGGGMAYTFAKAQGGSVGTSLLESDWLDYCNEMIAKAKAKGVKFLLPVDNYCAAEFSADAEPVLYDSMAIPDNMMGMDIGPKTCLLYTSGCSHTACRDCPGIPAATESRRSLFQTCYSLLPAQACGLRCNGQGPVSREKAGAEKFPSPPPV